MTSKRVLSVGQCMADHGSISRTLQKAFGVEVVGADSADEALEKLRRDPFALVLVNRLLDADGSSGVDLIREIKADEELRPLPVMLVSNYQDAQEQAVQNGAERGFGKARLSAADTLSLLRRFLG